MKKLITTLLLSLIMSLGYSQTDKDIIGMWKFKSVSSTNPKCKNVDYFPITSFKFYDNGNAEFVSIEGNANSNYKVINKTIQLYNLTENGVKQKGTVNFYIQDLNSTSLILRLQYDCGYVDIYFTK